MSGGNPPWLFRVEPPREAMVGGIWEAGRRVWGLAALALLLVPGGATVLAVPYRHSLSTVRAYEAAPRTRGIPTVLDIPVHRAVTRPVPQAGTALRREGEAARRGRP